MWETVDDVVHGWGSSHTPGGDDVVDGDGVDDVAEFRRSVRRGCSWYGDDVVVIRRLVGPCVLSS